MTDESGATCTDTVTVNAGNTRPVVTIEIPENGKVADFGDTIPYEVSVTDAEDGSTGSGISCDNVRIEFKLGHDTHAHELSSDTGCSGEFTLTGIAGHGDRREHLHGHHRGLHRPRRRHGRPADRAPAR